MKRYWLILCFAATLLHGIGAEYTPSEIAGAFQADGFQKAFSTKDGKFYYDSTKAGDDTKFRWTRLAAPERVGGDVSLRFDWKIAQFDHFNGFELEFRSVEKDAFNAVIRREQTQPGKQFLTATVNIKGRETIKKQIPYGAYQGTLLLRRENGRLILGAENSKGETVTILECADFPAGAAYASVKFTSAARTRGKIEIRGISVEGSEKFSTSRYPVFEPSRKIADATVLGGEKITRNADGTYTIQPGGVLVCALRGDANMKSAQLRFSAEGAVKTTAFQAGNNEPAVTGEIVLWDDDAPAGGFQERTVALGSYLARWPWDRKWDYSLISVAPSLLFEIAPAADAEIRVGPAALHASVLRPASVENGIPAEAAFTDDGVLTPKRAGDAIKLSGKTLPFRTGDRIAGNFPALDLRLDDRNSALSIPVERRFAGLELIHTAGKQNPENSAVLAAWQFCYDDGTTATEFITLRWNTGVYASEFLACGNADYTWWGPVGFPRCELIQLPAGRFEELYNGIYRTRITNPHPEKSVRQLTLYRMPRAAGELLTLGLRLYGDTEAVAVAVEPDDSALTPGKRLPLRVFAWSPGGANLPEGERDLLLSREGGSLKVGELNFKKSGEFAFARTELTVPDNATFPAGPARFSVAGFPSPRLGVMPEKPGDFHYTMIAGPFSPRPDFDRIRRIGYDTVKLVIPWEESEPGQVEFPRSERYLKWIAGSGLRFSIRNHIRLKKGPDYFAKQAIFQKRYQPEKPVEDRPQIDPADPWAVSRIVNLYRETARFARANNAVSINANYGLRPETGLRRIDMGSASLAMFRKLLASKYPVAEINAATGMNYQSVEELQPLDLYNDRSGFLLKEYLVMHHRNLESAQRAVVEAIRQEGYTGHLTYNVSFHPIEQKLIGANTGAYLALSREFPPGSLFHETSDRYSLSFVKYLAAKRTLNLPYGDEGCLCPPPDLANRVAFLWMTMMQCFDTISCQWFGGKPGMLEVASQKSLHALLYNAQYLPDDFALALSLDTGFDEAPETVRSTLHGRTGSHYGLVNLLRELNLNADRYLIDAFPELDQNIRGRLLIDDITRSIRPAFSERLEKFIRNGGVFLASSETDVLNNHAFLRRFGIDPAETPSGKTTRRSVGKGAILFRNATWQGGGWDPGSSEAHRTELLKLFTEAGNFAPLVKTDLSNLFVTPYRDENGDLLLYVVNTRSRKMPVRVSWQTWLAAGEAFDHVTGLRHTPEISGEYAAISIEVEPFNATVLRIAPEGAQK